MLLACKQFEVDGAAATIRCMLPLVFAKDQGESRAPPLRLLPLCRLLLPLVAPLPLPLTEHASSPTPRLQPAPLPAAIKDRIVEALDQLYVTGWPGHQFTTSQAARNLVDLACGATLGESSRACRSCSVLGQALPLCFRYAMPAPSPPASNACSPPPTCSSSAPQPTGELGSLEEVVKEFVAAKFLRPGMTLELWEVAGRAHAAVGTHAAGADRCAQTGGACSPGGQRRACMGETLHSLHASPCAHQVLLSLSSSPRFPQGAPRPARRAGHPQHGGGHAARGLQPAARGGAAALWVRVPPPRRAHHAPRVHHPAAPGAPLPDRVSSPVEGPPCGCLDRHVGHRCHSSLLKQHCPLVPSSPPFPSTLAAPTTAWCRRPMPL